MTSEFGFLILAFGKQRYIDQAINLAWSLKRHMNGYPICIVTDCNTLPSDLFDHVVPLDRSKGGSFVQKLWLDRYTPFEKTMFIDSDCIVGASFREHIERLSVFAFTPVCERYLLPGDHDNDGWVKDIGDALTKVGGTRYPKFNGGIYYYDKSDASLAVFEKARAFLREASNLGLQNPSGGEIGDETVFALALASLGQLDLYDDGGRLMRTPIGIQSRFMMSEECADFRFMKSGRLVTPAICHFAGANVISLPYLKIADFTRLGRLDRRRKMMQFGVYVLRGWPHYLRSAKAALKGLKSRIAS
jgi:hypothetical protein